MINDLILPTLVYHYPVLGPIVSLVAYQINVTIWPLTSKSEVKATVNQYSTYGTNFIVTTGNNISNTVQLTV